MRKRFIGWVGIIFFLFLFQNHAVAQQKKLYVSSDDHTDYMWSANELGYDTLIPNMLDRWIFYNDSTKSQITNPNYQSKWNCDGSYWVWNYKRTRPAAQFDALIAQIRSGQITVPYSPLVTTYGGMPAEAILRGMFYAGELERAYNLDFDMAIAMENQTLPLGLASLWKGAGAKYCWHGVCNCSTQITDLQNRQHEMYWYKGLDTNRILLKWYRLEDPLQNYYLGGYGEARNANSAIDGISAKCDSIYYNYNIAAAFGVGHDNLQTLEDELVPAAMDPANSNAAQQVIVSNEVDFFKDFETTYGSTLPTVTQTFGNEWDLTCASIAEVSAKIKRSLEKLRSAEAMAAINVNYAPTFAGSLDSLRREAWMALGLYWEHSLGFGDGAVPLSERYFFQTRLQTTFSDYVDQLYALALSNLSSLITKSGTSLGLRFFAFNPLGWERTGYADYQYPGNNQQVIDVVKNIDVPAQLITKNGVQYLRILADSIPSVGYKVFEIQSGPVAFPTNWYTTGVNGSYNFIETDSFKVTYTNQGVITSIIDKQNGNREVVASGGFLNDLGSGNANVGTASIENAGAVSVTVVTSSLDPLAHTTRITLFKNIGRIEIDNQITQNFTDTKTWNYAFNITAPEVWHEETGAVIKAKLTSNGGHYATQNARYDWSTLNHFASVNDTITNYGVTLSNEDCYFMKVGNSTITTLDESSNSAQLKVLAGGKIDGLGIVAQGGETIFNQRFAITTHTGYTAAAEMKKALDHQDAMVCGEVYNPVNFLLPNKFSFFTNDDPGAVLWALKPAEGVDRGSIARIWNLSNTDATPTIRYNLAITNAYKTTHVETDINTILPDPGDLRKLHLNIGHNEMKTYRVKLNVLPLPVRLISFVGDRILQSNQLQWKVANELNITTYELQRSTDGMHFTTIAGLPIVQNAATNNYNYTDKSINTAIPYYYRLKIINNNNSFEYSNTIIIKAGKDASALIVYPNPAFDFIKANIILDKKSRCKVAITNAAGAIIKTMAPPLFESGNNYYTISIKELPAGEYWLVITTAEDKKYIKGFIKQ